MQPKRILLPTDFSACANAALTHAVVLARQYDAELHLLHVAVIHEDDPFHPTYHFPDNRELIERLEEISSAKLREQLAARGAEPLAIHRSLRRGLAPAPAILDYAAEAEIELIVMGAHGYRGLRRLLLGSVAEEVVRLAPCPVLTVRAAREQLEVEPVEEILVPLDFSGPSRFALGEAVDLAETHGARLHMVHVIEPPLDFEYYGPLHDRGGSGSFAALAPRVEKELEQAVAAAVGGRARWDVRVVGGLAAPRITELAAELEADVIVIATHGLTGLYRFFLGSVAERVVRGARCPVLTVKAPREEGTKEQEHAA